MQLVDWPDAHVISFTYLLAFDQGFFVAIKPCLTRISFLKNYRNDYVLNCIQTRVIAAER